MPGSVGGGRWGIFDAGMYRQGWEVPWGPGTIAGGLGLWVFTFGAVAFLGVPGLFVKYGAKVPGPPSIATASLMDLVLLLPAPLA